MIQTKSTDDLGQGPSSGGGNNTTKDWLLIAFFVAVIVAGIIKSCH